MCCSFWPVNFTKTITGTWEVFVDGKINHVMWYQNNVGAGTMGTYGLGIVAQVFEVMVRRALAAPGWREECAGPLAVNGIDPLKVEEEARHRQAGGKTRAYSDLLDQPKTAVLEEGKGNCLIIPLLGLWESIRLLNTTDVPHILNDVSQALIDPVTSYSFAAAGSGSYGGGGGGLVFLKFSIYDIVIAQNAATLPAALKQVNPLKRPVVNDTVFDVLEKWYQCPVAVCCFNNAETGEAKPLGFAFEPLFPEKIVVYTLDAHDGNAPVPDAMVRLDHTIFVGSFATDSSKCAEIRYRDIIPNHLSPYILRNAMGTQLHDVQLENGDIIFNTMDVREGRFDGLRSLPPFGPHTIPRLGHRVERLLPYVTASNYRPGDWSQPADGW